MIEGDIGSSARSATAEAGGEDAEPPSRGSRSSGPALSIITQAGDWSGFPDIDALIAEAAQALTRHRQARRLARHEVTIVLGDDALVRRLNGTYRAKDAPTNVLSFPFIAPPGAAGAEMAHYLGDIVLAEETIAREAAEFGIPSAHHLQHLVIHGLLHLLGFDHIADDEAERMEAIETQVLGGIGIADPYAAG